MVSGLALLLGKRRTRRRRSSFLGLDVPFAPSTVW
jgi:hypothetical protein